MSSAFTFSNDSALLDRDLVHHWLSVESYWAQGRTRQVQDAAIDGSKNYSVLDADGRQVAYARVVTDGATFAWLCDVFVDGASRGLGIGKMIVEGVIQDLEESSTVKRIMLATSTADGLYARYGFEEPSGPTRYMVEQVPRG